jgi:hypothetical protein
MITFFTTAKPFAGHDGIIQRNALRSWKLLDENVEVMVFGDEDGVAEVCAEMGLRYEPRIERVVFNSGFASTNPETRPGMKRLDFMFREAQRTARHPILCYSNCDIVLTGDFLEAVKRARQWREKFLLVGRRWDTDISSAIDFGDNEWAQKLLEFALANGKKQIPNYIDFFVFSRGFYDDVPPLVVGRSYWDHWLVWRALQGGLPVIDASRGLVAVHQNHSYGYHPQGKQGTNEDALALRNLELCGGGKQQASMHDASHAMTRSGKIIRTPLRRAFATLYAMRKKQGLLDHTFWLRKKLGLRRATLNKLRGSSEMAKK